MHNACSTRSKSPSTRAARTCARSCAAILSSRRASTSCSRRPAPTPSFTPCSLARAVLGAPPVTIVVGADQTGSGTAAYRARPPFQHDDGKRHCRAQGRRGRRARRRQHRVAAARLAAGIAMRADADAAVHACSRDTASRKAGAFCCRSWIRRSSAGARRACACLDEIARRWPRKVQVVVDACQARLGRRRLRSYLDRGYMVLITGSKFFGGPAFSGALLVPKGFSRSLDRIEGIAPGFFDYVGRCDWPMAWTALRSRFERRPNFGQWLRWEAALAEIGSYYAVPGAFRAKALAELAAGIEQHDRAVAVASPRSTARSTKTGGRRRGIRAATIFPFTLHARRQAGVDRRDRHRPSRAAA